MSDQKPPSIPPRKKSGKEDTAATPSTAPRSGAAARGAAVKTGGSTTTKATESVKPETATAAPAKPETAKPAAPAPKTETPAVTLTPVDRPAADRPSTDRPAQDRPSKDRPSKPAPSAASESGPRRVRLAVSRIDPWSVMKLSFLVSFAIGIMLVVAVSAVWLALNGMHVFASINDLVTEILADSNFDLLDYVSYDRVISATALISIVNVFLITALSTIGAFIYNISAALVGGVHLTMTDD